MKKLRKGDDIRSSRIEAHCSYVTREEPDTTRNRLCRRFFNFLGGKKTKRQAQNLTPADVEDNKPGVVSSDEHDPISDFNLDLLIDGEIFRNSQEEINEWDPCLVNNAWRRIGNSELIAQPSPEIKSTTESKASNDSVSLTEESSTSVVIVVDDTSWKDPEFQTGLEKIEINSSHEDEGSVKSQHISGRSSGVKELIPSGSTTAEDLAETLAAHIARERQASSAALSFSSYLAKEVTEWKRKSSLRTDSTESLLGWLTGPSASLKCTDDSNLQTSSRGSAGFATNVHLSSSALPEDDAEEQGLEPDEEDIIEEEDEGAVMVERTEPLSEIAVAISSAPLRASSGGPSEAKCWKSDVVDTATSVQSTLAVEVSTTMSPVVSRLKAEDVAHIDDLGFPSKRHGVCVTWGGGWVSSSIKETSTAKTPNAVSSMSVPSPSGRDSSPGMSLSTLVDSLSTVTPTEELDFRLPSSALGLKDTEAVRKLTHLLEELSTDELPLVRVTYP